MPQLLRWAGHTDICVRRGAGNRWHSCCLKLSLPKYSPSLSQTSFPRALVGANPPGARQSVSVTSTEPRACRGWHRCPFWLLWKIDGPGRQGSVICLGTCFYSPVGFKGNLSPLKVVPFFSWGLKQMEDGGFTIYQGHLFFSKHTYGCWGNWLSRHVAFQATSIAQLSRLPRRAMTAPHSSSSRSGIDCSGNNYPNKPAPTINELQPCGTSPNI